MIEVHPLVGIGEVQSGDHLAGLLCDAMHAAGLMFRAGDVLAITQKVVSKSEGRFAQLSAVTPGSEAQRLAALTGKDPRLVELVLAESTAVVRAAPGVLITRHRLGLVMANAGIDLSNSGEHERALLLPVDPDASATALAAVIHALCGIAPAVIITDSFGRPWRRGVTNVAIGAHGFASLVDRRGAEDRDGRRLEITEIAVADQISCAAGLVMGEAAEGVPAALVRGVISDGPAMSAQSLVRPLKEDLFQ